MSTFREDARNAFLLAIQRTAPQVLDDLAEGPERALAALPEHARQGWRWHQGARPLREELDAWAARWHLDAAWCRETAIETLEQWQSMPFLRRGREWAWRSSGWMQEEPDSHAPPAWTPFGNLSAEEARAEIDTYHARLVENLKARVAAAESEGLPVRRSAYAPETIERAVRPATR